MRLKQRSLNKYYLTIKELPAINLIEMYDKNDLTQLSKTGKICALAREVLTTIEDEIVDNFGVSKEYLQLHNLKKERELLYGKLLHSKDQIYEFHIEMVEKEITELDRPKSKKTDMYAAMAWIKKQGISIQEDTITVFWYFKYMEYLTKLVKTNGRR